MVRRRRPASDATARARSSATVDARAASGERLRFELVEDDDGDDLHDVRPESGPVSRGGHGVRRPGRVGLALVVAAGLALGASAAVTAVLDGSRQQDVRTLAGGLEPLREAPVERWSVALDPAAGLVAAPDAVVTVDDRLTAYAVEDGEALWRSEALGVASGCLPRAGDPARDVVVCVVPQGEGGVLLTTLDSRTGEVVGERVAQAAPRAVALVGSSDVVRAHLVGADVVVVREDAASGRVRWQHRVERRRLDGLVQPRLAGVRLEAGRGVVSVTAPGAVATFTEDGRALEEGEVWSIARLPDGRYAGNEYGRGTASVYTADGDEAFRVRGRFLDTALSDGSVPGVLVVNSFGGVSGVDAATGAVRWSLEGVGYHAEARVDGVVVLGTGRALHGVAVESGERLWDVDLPERGSWPTLTDGHAVIVSDDERTGGQDLVAIALEDGSVRWRWEVPDDAYRVVPADGRLLVLTGDRLAAVW
ncbi:outer membrane protein assembly factor BamB family protein [Cellulosimicrobium marinum]|uniref:outer membrane protein assembly factor BamB family protein n=1 Tax=Cellulosimicrobium marinum TaxID=1638992 RepID=UPI001E48367A|nr:PQQ-binding-like beta-propeller repeat protein [Cellulosimicrobium marinum]MCB7135416.1 PQQ-like beta-propeller repeat protein [Cellulosimicrobium marinum]